ncbi:MAG TPA: hypothetical protein VM802_07600 [Chitinophaga sp.]|uniref:hypothetical protein n=1 Tax=Chitinophaga sp. TaxID=1869181 RepID=UPI002B51E0B3|nr:hypothetical protein [Chitinophaga sp.]HVI44717.1 hypothetical protein [Chitinophaga sp.]
MKQSLRVIIRTMLMGGITLVAVQAEAQLKVGTNPTKIEKTAILELESKKQGLLLTRLDNLTDIGTTVPDGMIVFLRQKDGTNEKGLYLRKDNAWVLIASASDASSNWSLKGNTGDATSFLGTTGNFPLTFKTNNTERLRITEGGNLQAAAGTVTAGTNELDVLVLKADGTIVKRTMTKDVFTNAVQSINGIDGAVTLKVDAQDTYNKLDLAVTGSTLQINAPIMKGDPAQLYGFMSLSDWNKLNKLSSANGITVTSLISAAAGADLDKGAQIKYVNGAYELSMIKADATHAGIVSTDAQTFAGDKTFNNKVIVNDNITAGQNLDVLKNLNVTGNFQVITGGNTDLGGTLNVSGATTLKDPSLKLETTPNAVIPPNSTDFDWVLVRDEQSKLVYKRQINPSAFSSAINAINGLKGPAITLSYTNAGGNDVKFYNDPTIPNELKLNIPNASAAATSGLITNDRQAFGGAKVFGDSVYTGKSLKVGDVATIANSTLQVAGSVSMPLNVVNADYTITPNDYTIIVKSAAPVTVTLPSAKDIKGRMYTIKKAPAVSGAPGSGADANIDNTVTIAAPATNFIEDGTSTTINNDWTFITVQSDGNNTWYIIKK